MIQDPDSTFEVGRSQRPEAIVRQVRPAAALPLAIALLVAACGSSGAIVDEGDATPPPETSDALVITSPTDGSSVSTPEVTVIGTAPDGADVVLEVRLGNDAHASAAGGQWSMQVDLSEGENLLTFRVGDDESTSATLLVIYQPSAVASAENRGTALLIATPIDGATVASPTVTVSGSAPDGADVVRDVGFGFDDHTTAIGGQWSMQVDLNEGENVLTFRVGDDDSTATTLHVVYESTAEPTQTPEPEPTEETDDEPDPLAVKVTKRTTSVPRNGTASITIKTTKGAKCSIDVVYNSGSSTAAGLTTKTAGGSGSITWKWKVGGRTTKGTYPIYVTCEKGEREGSTDSTFRVR